MSTATLIRQLLTRPARTVRNTLPRTPRRREALVEALEGRTLFSLLGVMDAAELPIGSTLGDAGTYSYTAAAHKLDDVSMPISFITPDGVDHPIQTPSAFNMHIKVDNAGALLGSGDAAHDLELVGDLDADDNGSIDYSGVLLTGTVAAFGFEDSGDTDFFDFRFKVTGGALATLFAGKDIGLFIAAEGSTFTGDFSADFSALAKGLFAAIPSTGTPPLTISGHKFNDVAGNGLGGGDDVPLADWKIDLYADTNNSGTLDAGDSLVQIATTAADGSYLFQGLAAGTYFVKEQQQDNWVATGPASGQYTVTLVDASAADKDFANYQCVAKPCCWCWCWCKPSDEPKTLETARSSISGSVFVDKDNDGKQDWCEPGIKGVKITLTGTDLLGNFVTKTTYTDCTGDYTFSNLIAGNYTVTECQPACYIDGKDYAGTKGGTVSNDKISNITLPPCTDARCYNFTECKTASISGNVFLDKDGDGSRDCWEKGLAGVTVKLTGTNDLGESICLTVKTDCYGNFCFDGLRAGTYTLTEVTPTGYATTKNRTGSEGGCVSGDKISNITLECGDRACGYSFGEKPTTKYC